MQILEYILLFSLLSTLKQIKQSNKVKKISFLLKIMKKYFFFKCLKIDTLRNFTLFQSLIFK